MTPLILASSSPYRRQLLAQLGLPFSCHSPDIDEIALDGESPQQLVSRLAEQKALIVAKSYGQHLIIGSDQVACLDKATLCKPGNFDTARKQLMLCSGKTVTFYTGLTLLNSASNTLQTCIEPYTVTFRPLSTVVIERYLQKEQPYNCAGSFKMEGLGISLFEKLSGDDPNSLIGLPLIQLVSMLGKEGVYVP